MFINRKLYLISLNYLSPFILNTACEVCPIFGLTTPVNTSMLILNRQTGKSGLVWHFSAYSSSQKHTAEFRCNAHEVPVC